MSSNILFEHMKEIFVLKSFNFLSQLSLYFRYKVFEQVKYIIAMR